MADRDNTEKQREPLKNQENSPVSDLPTVLNRRRISQLLFAGLIMVFSAALFFWEGLPLYLAGFLIAGYIAYQAEMLRNDFANGNITELSVVCISANKLAGRKDVRVVFRTEGDVPSYFEFRLLDRLGGFIPNAPYLIYFREKDPKQLIAYMAL